MANIKQYVVQPGDGWIRVANRNNINLDDLLLWNGIDPTSKQKLPTIHPNQKLYVQDPFSLQASVVTAKAPDNYVDFGKEGQKEIDKWATAVQQGKVTLNKVPKRYQEAVMQRTITKATDKAAAKSGVIGANVGAFFLNPIGYLFGMTGEKALAYGADKISGRNEYGTGDLLTYTPIMGREYAEEHPGKAATVNLAANALTGGFLSNIVQNPGALGQYVQFLKNATVTGESEGSNLIRQGYEALRTKVNQAADAAEKLAGRAKFNTKYYSSTAGKGVGKTGTVTRNSARGTGYSPNISAKGNFGNQSTGARTITWMPEYTSVVPQVEMASIPYSPMIPGFIPQLPEDQVVTVIASPERHIYQQQSWNRWQLPNRGTAIGPYQPGTGSVSFSGEAPIASVPQDQRFTNESIIVNNQYRPSGYRIVPGSVVGTPSNVYSTVGFEQHPTIKVIK